MAKRIVGTTPRQDGYRMPGEFEEQTGVWMLWPQRPDNWRGGAKPAQQAFADVARAIARFEPVTVCVNPDQFQNARARLPEDIRVVEMTSNDAWVRDCGPTFVKNDQGDLRAVDWTFNAWGGLHDGLYFPWDQDDLVARINGQPARQYASQGQTRTAALSLKLAERELFRDDTGQWPILLLDDVLSELDARRQDFVLRRITGGQVILTGCEAPDGSFPEGRTLHIMQGKLVNDPETGKIPVFQDKKDSDSSEPS